MPTPGEGPVLRIAAMADFVVARICETVLVLTGVALMVVMSANVIARYVLASGGFDWAQEVPERLFPWFIMAGVALAVQKGGHIAVEWLLGKIGREAQRWVLLLGHAIVAASYIILVEQAMVVADIAAIERSPALGLSGSHGYWAVAAGCVLLVIGTATNALRVLLLGPEAMPQPKPEDSAT